MIEFGETDEPTASGGIQIRHAECKRIEFPIAEDGAGGGFDGGRADASQRAAIAGVGNCDSQSQRIVSTVKKAILGTAAVVGAIMCVGTVRWLRFARNFRRD